MSVFLIKTPEGDEDERSDTLDWSDLLNIFAVRSAPDGSRPTQAEDTC